MKPGDRVKLVPFNASTAPLELVDARENYWLMIGQSGLLQSVGGPQRGGGRVLVVFDGDPQSHGLEAHNEIPHALWIEPNDLEVEVGYGE